MKTASQLKITTVNIISDSIEWEDEDCQPAENNNSEHHQ